MIYDSNLDGALRGWAQGRMQDMTAPDATEPSAKALRAGIEASELQSAYLETLRSAASESADR
jgi:hypothetical protein